jgi:hypothetical protein
LFPVGGLSLTYSGDGMKKLFFLQLVLVFSSILAQSGSVNEAIKYYPLNNGNYWEYEESIGELGGAYTTSLSYWLNVIGDTVFSNGKTYKKIKQGSFSYSDINWRYERIDSTTLAVYRIYDGIEYKIDSLSAKPGDRITCSRFNIPLIKFTNCISEGEETWFDQQYMVKTMQDPSTSMNYQYKLVAGLGYCYSVSYEIIFQATKLTYARINGVEYGIKTGINRYDQIPTQFILFQNYPNPFNPATKINYTVPKSGFVTIKVYDLLGREVTTLVNENKPVGNYNVEFNAGKLVSGVYFYRMKAGDFVQTKKLILLK